MPSTSPRPGPIAVVLALAALGGLAGCGDDPRGPRASPVPSATPGAGVLYDGEWLVEEGQWWLGSAEAYFDRGDIPTFQRILESVNSGSVSITVPGADGRYRTRVELDDGAPPVAGWCEDVAEASLEVAPSSHVITMGSFESFKDLPVPGAGWYRVRYCTEAQDRAAGEDAFVGDDYTTYTGRHLIQIWPAPQAADQLVGEGSRWAQQLHARATAVPG